MAIKKTITLTDNFGEPVTFTDAYIKVTHISGGKSSLSARIEFWKRDKSKLLDIRMIDITPDLEGDNFISQVYAHIKTLEEFAGAIDC